LLKKLSFCYL